MYIQYEITLPWFIEALTQKIEIVLKRIVSYIQYIHILTLYETKPNILNIAKSYFMRTYIYVCICVSVLNNDTVLVTNKVFLLYLYKRRSTEYIKFYTRNILYE